MVSGEKLNTAPALSGGLKLEPSGRTQLSDLWTERTQLAQGCGLTPAEATPAAAAWPGIGAFPGRSPHCLALAVGVSSKKR